MSLGLSYSLFVFKKHYTCAHKYGCLEHFLRKLFKGAAIWLLAKGAISLLLGIDINEEIISMVKDNFEPVRNWGKEESDLALIGAETLLVSGYTVFKTMRCWKQMLAPAPAVDESNEENKEGAKEAK